MVLAKNKNEKPTSYRQGDTVKRDLTSPTLLLEEWGVAAHIRHSNISELHKKCLVYKENKEG